MIGESDDEKCVNCGHDFADHNYVKDSIVTYLCPEKMQHMGYGFFHGGDPRTFFPDEECCTEQELKSHKRACDLWYDAEKRGETPTPENSPSGWIDLGNGDMCHVLRSRYGIGVFTYELQNEFEPVEKYDDYMPGDYEDWD